MKGPTLTQIQDSQLNEFLDGRDLFEMEEESYWKRRLRILKERKERKQERAGE